MRPLLLAATLFAVGCLAGAAATNVVVPTVRAGTSPTRWEYSCFKEFGYDDDGYAVKIQGAANRLGKEGWELAGVGAGGSMWCFKRALP